MELMVELSEYTELYTRMFCQRVARTICASFQVQELPTISQDMILGSMEDFAESASKRRRLNSKVSKPEGYPATTSPSVPEGNVENTSEASSSHDDLKSSKKMILDQALQLAPRVGKTVLEHGALFDVVQQAFPDHIVRVVELCKGADRFRKSPVKLIPQEAPLCMTLGIHRHSLEPFPDCQWEQWENLSMRQLCSKSPPARLLVTVFAREKSGIKRDHEDDLQGNQSTFCFVHLMPTRNFVMINKALITLKTIPMNQDNNLPKHQKARIAQTMQIILKKLPMDLHQ